MTSGTWTLVNNLLANRRLHATWGWQQNSIGVATGDDGSNHISTAEEYNGTSWSSVNNVLTAVQAARGAGTISAGLICGGRDTGGSNRDITEEYDGTSWSSVNTLLTARRGHGSSGRSQSTVLAWGGVGINPPTLEEYDGTSWSNTGYNYPELFMYGGTSGTSTDTISTGGGYYNTHAYTYDGSGWTRIADLPVSHRNHMAAGESNSAIVASGYFSNTTEEFNGTSWQSESNTNASQRDFTNQTGGTHDLAILAGGNGALNTSEEWDDVPVCWNYTARYLNSNKLFKLSGCGPYPKHLRLPNNVDKSTGKLIDDGKLIDPDDYEVE